MSGTVNKVILIGNVGKDPEVRYLENGVALASISMATTESYTDKTTGEKRDLIDWHQIVFWRGLAEVVNNYVKKGMKLYVEGKLRTRSYTDKDNIVRYVTEVVADEMQILTPKNTEGQKSNSQANYPPTIEPEKKIPPVNDMHHDEDNFPF